MNQIGKTMVTVINIIFKKAKKGHSVNRFMNKETIIDRNDTT